MYRASRPAPTPLRHPAPRRARRVAGPVAVLALVLGLAGLGPGSSGTAAASAATAPVAAASATAPTASRQRPFTVTTLHFKVRVGPSNATTCTIIGDLYRPRKATRRNRVPAVLTTNGFGGSKDGQAGMAKLLARRGYVVLSYSGLGFGGSGCKITLDDPDWDGKAARQLVSYLGGKRGIAFRDAGLTKPTRLRVVQRDRRDHRGERSRHDPRVGMWGGSYGGQIQFAAASVDPRIDALVPLITWNDLSYALAPNNTGQTGVSSATSGAVKFVWGFGFSGLGIVDGLTKGPKDPSRLLPCPNFADFVCPALVTAAVTGSFDAGAVQKLRHASVSSYMERIRVPVLLVQGQNDTLFNLNEGIATFRALRKQRTPVKMIWQWSGHSDGVPAPGEYDDARPRPAKQYLTRRMVRWFQRHLKGKRVSTGPRFAYFRDWVRYSGDAAPAYASSRSFPVGNRKRWLLSGDRLVRHRERVQSASQSFLTPVAGLPTSLDEFDAIGALGTAPPLPEVDLPGTFADWTGARLRRPVKVVGTPKLRIRVDAPISRITQVAGETGQVVLFAKLVDVAPDGEATVIRNLVAPVRVPDANRAFTVTMPAIVHKFRTGHRIRLVLAGGSTNYRGNVVANPVTVRTGGAGQALTLPVVR